MASALREGLASPARKVKVASVELADALARRSGGRLAHLLPVKLSARGLRPSVLEEVS
jgi:hypothetical protein